MNAQVGVYPDINDHDFNNKINKKKEFNDNKITNTLKNIFCLEPQQRFLANYINPLTPYNSILVYHSVGVGKTLTAIAIAENFKEYYNILVLVKNKSLELNFKRELLGVCSNYNQESGLTEINKHYTFITYGVLRNRYVNKTIKNLNNTLLIIDEVHNVINNNNYFIIKRLLNESDNTKVVLLSATPIYNNVTEIFEIANLLGSNLPIRKQLLNSKYIHADTAKIDNFFFKNPINTITFEGEQVIRKELKGKVSYLIANKEFFPKRVFVGTKLDKDTTLKVIKCIMHPFQAEGYKKTLSVNVNYKTFSEGNEKDNIFFSNSSNASTIVYPNGEIGKNGFITNKNKIDYLDVSNIGKFSCKLHQLLLNLKKYPGNSFIYSNFVINSGTMLISKLLLVNGYSRYRNGEVNDNSYIVLDDQTTSVRRAKLIKIFNSKENANGSIIKIIIGSPVVNEGLTFKSIRNIHIIEPYWNLSRVEQIIGRGVRFNSHSYLTQTNRTTNIFLYVSIDANNIDTSIDYLKYVLAEQKDHSIKNIENILKSIAVDCYLNKKRNVLDATLNYTRECGYQLCNYKCVGIGSKPVTVLDISTFSLPLHSPDLYKFIAKKITDLFKHGWYYNLDNIVKYVNRLSTNINIYNIYYVINDYVDNEIVIKNMNNIDSIISYISGYYIITPIGEPVNTGIFYKMFEKIKTKQLTVTNTKLTETNKKSIKKIDYSSLKQPIYGSYTSKLNVADGTFRMIDTRERSNNSNGVIDKRKQANSKTCMFYTKNELIEIAGLLGIPSDSSTKDKLCKEIEEYLKKNKLILA